MDEETFHEKLLDLIEEVKRFPEAKRESLEMLAGEIGKKYEDLRKSLMLLQDTLDSFKPKIFSQENYRGGGNTCLLRSTKQKLTSVPSAVNAVLSAPFLSRRVTNPWWHEVA